jgi:hypothetical protein
VNSSVTMQARLVRRAWRRAAAQRRFPDLSIENMPILFGNSFPKSGTHLLTQILAGFASLGPVAVSGLPPVLSFEGDSGQARPISDIQKELAGLKPGDITYGHLHAFPEVLTALCREGVAPFFIYRDPRDVVVSHVFYVTEINARHVHHDYYANRLNTFGERLKVSILGRPELEIPFPDIAARFEPYMQWMKRKEVLSLRFEDLVADKATSLEKILQHAIARGFPFRGSNEEAIAKLSAAIDPQRSPTFRSGKPGAWRKHFKAEHIALFKEISGDLLIRLGYEKDQNW